MLTVTVETLLDDFVACSDAIQDVVIFSAQGQLLTCPYSLTPKSAHILAGSMEYLTNCVFELCQWHVGWIIVQAQEGYLILAQYSLDAFLLVKATVAPTGYLQNQIQEHFEKLQTALQFSSQNASSVQRSYLRLELMNDTGLSSTSNVSTKNFGESPTLIQQPAPSFSIHLNKFEIDYCQKELIERIGPIASLVCNRTLQQNPNLQLADFIDVLSKHIPDQQAALEFQKRLLSYSI